METWNQRLKKAVDEKGLAPNAFARNIGVSAPTVAAWLGAGTIRPAKDIKADHLWKACDYLGIRPEWVLGKRVPMKVAGDTALTAQRGNPEAAGFPNTLENPNTLQITQELVEQFIADLRAAFDDGRLTAHRFMLLRELLREGAHAPAGKLEHQKMKTRGAHGRQSIRRGRTGTE